MAKRWTIVLRSALIGVFTGILPGAGGSIVNILAYDQAKKASKYPEKFGNPRRRQPATVAGAGSSVAGGGSGGGSGKKGYADLPAEEKAVCDRFVSDGIVKDNDEYLKFYEWED